MKTRQRVGRCCCQLATVQEPLYYVGSRSQNFFSTVDHSIVPSPFGWIHDNLPAGGGLGGFVIDGSFGLGRVATEAPSGGSQRFAYHWGVLLVRVPLNAGVTVSSAVFHFQDGTAGPYPPPNIPVVMYGSRVCYSGLPSTITPDPFPFTGPGGTQQLTPYPLGSYEGIPTNWHPTYNGPWITTPATGTIDGQLWTLNATTLINSFLSTATINNPYLFLLLYTDYPSEDRLVQIGPGSGAVPALVPNYLEITL